MSQCLTEIFLEFLVHWGAEFSRLEDHHFDVLIDLTDRECAKFNGVNPENFIPCSERGGEVPRYKKLRIADDIYKNVWIEMSELQQHAREINKASEQHAAQPDVELQAVKILDAS